ncbi:hypothetical protein M3M33_17290, partial [Loigolactobacillus coryniformis]|uniref:hypothetical protein n=1 Tax=Loigolactobacillus coryniformis TaxID=1610 RepID=UPI00201A6326
MGLVQVHAEPDFEALRTRIAGIEQRLEGSVTSLLQSQGVRLLAGTGRLVDPHTVEVTDDDGGTVHVEADTIVLS